jgi:hypothetical protein
MKRLNKEPDIETTTTKKPRIEKLVLQHTSGEEISLSTNPDNPTIIGRESLKLVETCVSRKAVSVYLTPDGLEIQSLADNPIRIIKGTTTCLLAKGEQASLNVNDMIELAFNKIEKKGFSALTLTYGKERKKNIDILSNFLEKISPPLKDYAISLEKEGFTVAKLHELKYNDLRELNWKMAHAKEFTNYFESKSQSKESKSHFVSENSVTPKDNSKESVKNPKTKPIDKTPVKADTEKIQIHENTVTTTPHKTSIPPEPKIDAKTLPESKKDAKTLPESKKDHSESEEISSDLRIIPQKDSKEKKRSTLRKKSSSSKKSSRKKKSKDYEHKPQSDSDESYQGGPTTKGPTRKSQRIEDRSKRSRRKESNF